MTRSLAIAAAVLCFMALATANSGGYRFGISDQAYYGAAVVKSVHPTWYPRDTPLLAAQSRHMLSDDLMGWIARGLHSDLPPLFFAVYAIALAALAAAGLAFARGLNGSPWMAAALLLLLTLRHRIAKTGANSLEGYMHPRMLAFALGVAGLASVLRLRFGWACLWVGLAAVMHTTTAMWFGGVVAIAAAVARPGWRRPLLGAGLGAAAVAVWALSLGPLAGRLVIMDAEWLAVLQEKDYLFPSEWPLYAWVSNLAYPIVILAVFRRRRALGVLAPGETAVVFGLIGLIGVFLLSVVLSAAHLAIAVQLQTNRVFWIADFAMAAYLAWALMDGVAARRRPWMRPAILAILAAISIGRGFFVLRVEAGRPLVQIARAPGDWTDAMTWLATQPSDWHVLADPGHAWKYGESVRLAAGKDTVLEMGKDTALAMYDRSVAMRVAERAAALGSFPEMTSDDVRRLDARYELDVLVAEAGRSFDFPILYRNARFTLYDLR